MEESKEQNPESGKSCCSSGGCGCGCRKGCAGKIALCLVLLAIGFAGGYLAAKSCMMRSSMCPMSKSMCSPSESHEAHEMSEQAPTPEKK